MSKKFTEDAMWVLNSVYYMKDPKKITKEIEEGRMSHEELAKVMVFLENKGLINIKEKGNEPFHINLTDKGTEFIVNELNRKRQEEFNRVIAITGSILAIIASYTFLKEFIVDKSFLSIITIIAVIITLTGFFYLIKFLLSNLFNENDTSS